MRLISVQIKYEGKHKFFVIDNSIHLATKVVKEGGKKILTNLSLNGYDGYKRIDLPENYIKFIYPYLVVGNDIYQVNIYNKKTTLGYETCNLMTNQLKNARYKDGKVYYAYQESSQFYWDSYVNYAYPVVNDYYNNHNIKNEFVLNNLNYSETDITNQSTINTNLYDDNTNTMYEINNQTDCDMNLYEEPQSNNTTTNTNGAILEEDYTNLLYMVDALRETKNILNEENEDLIKRINVFKTQKENIEFMYEEIKIKNKELELENNKLKEELSTFNDGIENLINEF
jgi:hypothetical protein